jgi:hypothetical protein
MQPRRAANPQLSIPPQPETLPAVSHVDAQPAVHNPTPKQKQPKPKNQQPQQTKPQRRSKRHSHIKQKTKNPKRKRG